MSILAIILFRLLVHIQNARKILYITFELSQLLYLAQKMTTKPPSVVQEFASDSLEKIAYNSVSTIPTEEPNDRHRLGYHIWRWMLNKESTLAKAITESGARLLIKHTEALKIITESLQQQGVHINQSLSWFTYIHIKNGVQTTFVLPALMMKMFYKK